MDVFSLLLLQHDLKSLLTFTSVWQVDGIYKHVTFNSFKYNYILYICYKSCITQKVFSDIGSFVHKDGHNIYLTICIIDGM